MPGTPSFLMTYQMSVQCDSHPCSRVLTHRVTIAISRLQQSPGHGHRTASQSAITLHWPRARRLYFTIFVFHVEIRSGETFQSLCEQQNKQEIVHYWKRRRKTKRLSLVWLIFPWRSDSWLDAVFSLFSQLIPVSACLTFVWGRYEIILIIKLIDSDVLSAIQIIKISFSKFPGEVSSNLTLLCIWE